MKKKYLVHWCKTYNETGTQEIEAESIMEAEEICADNSGDYTGNTQLVDCEIQHSEEKSPQN